MNGENWVDGESGAGSVGFFLNFLLCAAAAADDESLLELLLDERLALLHREEQWLPAFIAHGFVEVGFAHQGGNGVDYRYTFRTAGRRVSIQAPVGVHQPLHRQYGEEVDLLHVEVGLDGSVEEDRGLGGELIVLGDDCDDAWGEG